MKKQGLISGLPRLPNSFLVGLLLGSAFFGLFSDSKAISAPNAGESAVSTRSTQKRNLPPKFSAKKFAFALDGEEITARNGERYLIRARTPREGKVVILVFNQADDLVAQGERTVESGVLGFGHFDVMGSSQIAMLVETFQLSFAKLFSDKLGFQDMDSISFRLSFSEDYSEISGIRLLDGQKMEVLNIRRTNGRQWRIDDLAMELAKKNNLENWLNSNFQPSFSAYLAQENVRLLLDDIFLHRANIDKGIASAVYQKYFDIVPRGTLLEVHATNLETVDYLTNACSMPLLTGKIEREVALQLRKLAENTLWGKVLTKAGWQCIDVNKEAANAFSLVFIKP